MGGVRARADVVECCVRTCRATMSALTDTDGVRYAGVLPLSEK